MAEHKHADVIHAIADGKEVEGFDEITNEWFPLGYNFRTPVTFEHLEWRIKPEKKVLRYRVALLEKDGYKFTQTADSTDDAIELATCPYFSRWVTVWIEVEVE